MLKRISTIAICFAALIFSASCGSSGNESSDTPIYDTTPTGPAPNNTNATFPSMSDSATTNPDSTRNK